MPGKYDSPKLEYGTSIMDACLGRDDLIEVPGVFIEAVVAQREP